jgi:hypothetical protein
MNKTCKLTVGMKPLDNGDFRSALYQVLAVDNAAGTLKIGRKVTM